MSIRLEYPTTLEQAIGFFSRPQVAERLFVFARWKQGKVCCPQCGSSHVTYLGDRYRRWECRNKHARRQFTVKMGTIMENSPLSLQRWAVALWVIHHEKPVSSYQLHRALGVTQKSAWLLLHRVRKVARRNNSIRRATKEGVSAANRSKGLQRWVGRVVLAPKHSTAEHGTLPAVDR